MNMTNFYGPIRTVRICVFFPKSNLEFVYIYYLCLSLKNVASLSDFAALPACFVKTVLHISTSVLLTRCRLNDMHGLLQLMNSSTPGEYN